MARYKLSFLQAQVLAAIYGDGENGGKIAMPLYVISPLILQSDSSVENTVRDLEAMGLVEYSDHHNAKIAMLTPDGRSVIKEAQVAIFLPMRNDLVTIEFPRPKDIPNVEGLKPLREGRRRPSEAHLKA